MAPLPTRALATALLLAAGAFALPGCSDEDEPSQFPNPTPTTQFAGVFAGGAEGGRVDVTIMTTSLAPAKRGAARRVAGSGLALTPFATALATVSPTGGGTANLTGTYDAEADTLNLSGSGYAIRATRAGSLSAPELMGSVKGPNGTAGMRCAVDGATPVSPYCATYESGATTLTGMLNFFITGTDLAGVAVETGASAGAWVDGTAAGAGATRNLTFSGTFGGGHTIICIGVLTVATGDVLGTWTLYDIDIPIDTGSWIGQGCLAGTTGPN